MSRQLLHASCVAVSLLAAPGCGPSPDAPLPAFSDGPREYSLAVAKKAHVKVSSQKALALWGIGRVYQRFGNEDKALEYFDLAIDEDPTLTEAYNEKGFILSQGEGSQLDEAWKAYDQVLIHDSKSAGVHTRIGLILSHKNRIEESIEEFRKEIRAGTADDMTYYNLAKSYELIDKKKEAIEAYRKAVSMNPGLRMGHYNIGRLLKESGDTKGAAQAQTRFQEIKQAEEAASARCEGGTDNLTEQRRFAADTWLDAYSLFLAEAGSREEERRTFQREALDALVHSIRVDPTYVEPHLHLIRSYQQLGRAELALRAGENALERFPESFAVLRELGKMYNELGARPGGEPYWEKELDIMRRMVRLEPELAKVHHNIAAIILDRVKRPDLVPLAIRHARMAIEREPSPRTYDLLAWAYFQQGQLDTSTAALIEGIERFPNDAGLKDKLRKLKEKQK